MPGQKKLGLLMGKSMVSLADGSQGLPEGSLTSPPAGSPNATRTLYLLCGLPQRVRGNRADLRLAML